MWRILLKKKKQQKSGIYLSFSESDVRISFSYHWGFLPGISKI